jgi:hypothetical protein
MKNILFCLSNLSLPYVITLINDKKMNKFLIITSNKQIYKFLTKIYLKKNVEYVAPFSFIPKRGIRLFLLPLYIIKIYIRKYSVWKKYKKYKNQNVYFFFNTAAFSSAWLIYKLSKSNSIFYKEDIDLSSYPIKKKKLLEKLSIVFIKYLYNQEVCPINQGAGIVSYKIDNQFLDKIRANTIDIKLDYMKITEWVGSSIILPKGDVLMLTEYMEERCVSLTDHIKISDELISMLNSINLETHIKSHPRSDKKYSLEKTLIEVPKYIPASFLLNYSVFISYMSSALVEAANQNIISISLVNIMPLSDSNRQSQIKVFLRKNLNSEKVIHFPNNLQELKSIIQRH